jgi:hypothetical protein
MAKNARLVTALSSTPLGLNVKPQVDSYEVLVEANFPTRWVYQPLAAVPSSVLAGANFA